MNTNDTIYVAGHNGMVGSAIVRLLKMEGFDNVLTVGRDHCNLVRQDKVDTWFDRHDIDYVFLAAAKVGGIHANNSFGAQFIYENLAIQTNVIHAAYKHGVKGLLFLGSSCIYPRDCPQPIKEEYLMTGPLESTNESYAIAKIAGLKMVEAYNREYGTRYMALMPTNLYGMNDNFDLNTSHVVPALLRKFNVARQSEAPGIRVWGTGTPRREFLLVDDLADACLFCMRLYGKQSQPGFTVFNVGSGEEVSIAELARMVAQTVGYEGNIEFDSSMPDGTPRKLLDSSRINALGWRARKSLGEGLGETYEWFLKHQSGNAVAHSSH